MSKNQDGSNETFSFSFSDFPEDVQLCILSFLTPSEVSTFACTSKRFFSLCRDDAKVWFSMCDRRWGSKTQIKRWGKGKVTYKQLYRILDEYDNLIGFWCRSGDNATSTAAAFNFLPPLVFFEWGPFFISGSRVSPSKNGTYNVIKEPFLWMSVAPNGKPICFLDRECGLELSENLVSSGEFGLLENELVLVNVDFIGKYHVVVEENASCDNWYIVDGEKDGNENGVGSVSSSGNTWGEDYGVVEDVYVFPGSSSDRLMSQIYQHFANRRSPGGNVSSRRQRREKERQGRKRWGPDYFVKIVNCSPTPTRPLQGLWKGINEDMNLDFYLVAYDDLGGIACRRIGDWSKPFSGYAPVFWTSNTRFIKPPFSPEEEYEFEGRVHLRPPAAADDIHGSPACSIHEAVLCILNINSSHDLVRILNINSSYDLVIPDLAGTTADPRQVEGRVWQYRNGTFGFGFPRNNYIVNLKYIAQNGCLLDTIEPCNG